MDGNKVRRSASQWQEILERYRAGDQSVSAFCRSEGLALSTFQHWRRVLGSKAGVPRAGQGLVAGRESTAPLFAALSATQATEPSESVTGGRWHVELDLGAGIRLSLRRVA